ncbi:MAG TPA: glycosyltransferase family 39 protein, partial [Roseiflexaceae bacterium]|nr:glycosyltransferase family 39 protein [Roseiflexaceae bacterium]
MHIPVHSPPAAGALPWATRVLRREALLLALAAAVYLAARLPALQVLPLFNDEAVYLLRAAVFPADLPSTLGEGKLMHELLLPLLTPLPGDPLVPARLLSVACGLGTIVGLWYCGRALGSGAAGALAGLLYATAPIAILHDLLAISDSLLTCAATLVLLASLHYAQHPRPEWRHAALLGTLLGLAALVKLPGLFLFAVPVLLSLALAPPPDRARRALQLRSALLVALVFIAALAPLHYGGAERAKLGVATPAAQLAQIGANAAAAGDWLLRYLPAPL